MPWKWGSGPVGLAGTGPQVDHTLSSNNGHYIYIDASSYQPGSAARLLSSEVTPGM